jgi:hypothetical protein
MELAPAGSQEVGDVTYGSPALGYPQGGYGQQQGGYGQQQLAPQGFFGDLIGSVAAPIGGAIGGAFGNQQLGQQIGGLAGQGARWLPFEAGGPYGGGQQLAPQGFFGDLIGTVAPQIGGHFGGGLGQQIGGLAGQAARLLPFEAGPYGGGGGGGGYGGGGYGGGQQLAPQGFFGDLIGSVAAPIGSAIGGAFGHGETGQAIGGLAGQAARWLPFSADPYGGGGGGYGGGQQLAPQGLVGDFLGAVGRPVGSFVGGRFGNAGLGGAVGDLAGQAAQRWLPFAADPYAQAQAAQLAPQGFFGGILGSALGGLGGGAIGNLFGNRDLGENIGRIAGGAGGAILPFSAQPFGAQQGVGGY